MFMYKYNSGLLSKFFFNFKIDQDVNSYNTRQSTQKHIFMTNLEIRIMGTIIYFKTRLKFTTFNYYLQMYT